MGEFFVDFLEQVFNYGLTVIYLSTLAISRSATSALYSEKAK